MQFIFSEQGGVVLIGQWEDSPSGQFDLLEEGRSSVDIDMIFGRRFHL